MSEQLQALTHGARGLELGYLIVFVALLVGLLQGRAPGRALMLSPILALGALLFAVLVSAITSSFWRNGDDLRTVISLILFAVIGYATGRVSARKRLTSDHTHRRGAVVRTGEIDPQLGNGTDAHGTGGITIAGVAVALADETKHFKFIGTTGTGKSTAIVEILTAALARGDRAIIADPDGGYLARFYDSARGDVILNPFDGEARKWDLFGEITNDYDVEQLARSLIPDSAADRIWTEYARTFFIALMQQCLTAGIRSDGELLGLIDNAPIEELRVMLTNTAAAPFLAAGNERMFGSVRSVASSAIRVLKYTTRQNAEPLSVRQWARNGAPRSAGGKGGVLFIPYKAGEIAALRSVISAWMRIGIFEAMDREEGDQRLWFVIDELDALGEIDGLKDALARLRKFGGRCILGFQSIAQVSGTYGKGVAETIVENCGNTLILRCSASERGGTSEFASKLIGMREVMHTTQSHTRRPGEWMSSTTKSEQLKIEPAIMASEIERLADLHGFLKVASVPDWKKVILKPMGEAPPARPRKPVATTVKIDPDLQEAPRKSARR
jgi:type IV secretory pathway TraG/TraD family ATPase VirD4